MTVFWIILGCALYAAGMVWFIRADKDAPSKGDDAFEIASYYAILCPFWPITWIIKHFLSFEHYPFSPDKSPFTGGKVEERTKDTEVTFRGEKITAPRHYYHCVDTGHDYTNCKLDDEFMWEVFKQWCQRKGIYDTFTDIISNEFPEIPEIKLNRQLAEDQRVYEYLAKQYYYNHDFDGYQSREDHPCMDREDMLEFAKYFYGLDR